jgi:sec-independent protein translocase protein TatA
MVPGLVALAGIARQSRLNRYALRMPFGIGIWELLILLLVLLLVFGPKRLPEMGRQLGKGMREFKESVSGKDDDPVDDMAELPPAEPSTSATPSRERDTVS